MSTTFKMRASGRFVTRGSRVMSSAFVPFDWRQADLVGEVEGVLLSEARRLLLLVRVEAHLAVVLDLIVGNMKLTEQLVRYARASGRHSCRSKQAQPQRQCNCRQQPSRNKPNRPGD